MTSEPVLQAIREAYFESARRDSFNGLVAARLLRLEDDLEVLRAHLETLVDEHKITCVFAKADLNMHIKRFPDIPVERQQELLRTEEVTDFCVYPTGSEIAANYDVTQWNDRPFSKCLVLAEPQLAYRAFDMGVLERYTSDPRYTVHFADYMGRMSVNNEPYSDEAFPDRDKVAIQSFGLGFNEQRIPHAVVYLRYLSNLSPEHQQYWNSYKSSADVRMCRQYFESSILGEFWKNRSVRYAIVEEMKLINTMAETIWSRCLFRGVPTSDVPIGLTSFLRPTAENYHRFVLALDKLLSDSVDFKFFEGKVPLEWEKTRPDGKVEVVRKGTLTLLEEWLLKEITWPDEAEFRDVIIAPLRKVRKLRQKPAHKITSDNFSIDYYDSRKELLSTVLSSLANIRHVFSKHPAAIEVEVPSWLEEEEIEIL